MTFEWIFSFLVAKIVINNFWDNGPLRKWLFFQFDWYLADYYTIYNKNACLSITFQLWMISTHCLGLKNKFFDIQNPHLATLNMILCKKLAKWPNEKFKLWKNFVIFPPFCCFSLFIDPMCFLMAKKGFSSSNYIGKVSFYLINFIKLAKQAPKQWKMIKNYLKPTYVHIGWSKAVYCVQNHFSPSPIPLFGGQRFHQVKHKKKPIEVFGSGSVPKVDSDTIQSGPIQSCKNFQS